MLNHGGDRCISFGSLRIDQAVGAEVLRLLKPLGVEAALSAIAARTAEAGEKQRQIELALKQARYEANLARRQYDAVDPDNRLVAGELERRTRSWVTCESWKTRSRRWRCNNRPS